MTRWKPAHVLIEEKTDVRRGDQGFDPEVTAVRLSAGRVAAGIQRDHRAAGVPVDGLVGSVSGRSANRLQTEDPGPAIGGDNAQWTSVNGFESRALK